MFELIDNLHQDAVIKVIGVGGGGGNAVKHMIANKVEGVEFICANTDAQALKDIDVRTVLQLGTSTTKGLGAGANPDVGRQAAMEDRERIAEILRGAAVLSGQRAVAAGLMVGADATHAMGHYAGHGAAVTCAVSAILLSVAAGQCAGDSAGELCGHAADAACLRAGFFIPVAAGA